MKNLTAILITFLRPEYTMECIKSLKKLYPDIKIIVGDNEKYNPEMAEFVKRHGGLYVVMPYDSGVCFARNRLVELVETKFVLVGDDDFYYEQESAVDKMLSFMDRHEEYALIGGRVKDPTGNVQNYQGIIDIFPDHLEYINLDPAALQYDSASGLDYQTADIVFNYFVARVADIKKHPWDEKIKVAFEHSDWFISLKKAGVTSAYSPQPIVIHKPAHITPKNLIQYKGYRYRRSDMTYFFEKHKVDYCIGFNGVRTMARQDAPGTGNFKARYYAIRPLSHNGKSYNTGDMIETNNPTDAMRPI